MRLAKASWLAWPAWVGFAVISTGNHYWLDVVAASRSDSRPAGRFAASTRCDRSAHDDEQPASEPARANQLDRVKQEYTQAAREILQRSMRGVAKTSYTGHADPRGRLPLSWGAVLVGFEARNEKLFFWLGGALSVDRLRRVYPHGALARAASKGTVFGAFLDSTFDCLGEAAMLTAIGLVFTRNGNEVALVATFAAVIGSSLVSYTRAKAEALGLRADVGFGSRVERVVLIRSRSSSLRGTCCSGRSTSLP